MQKTITAKQLIELLMATNQRLTDLKENKKLNNNIDIEKLYSAYTKNLNSGKFSKCQKIMDLLRENIKLMDDIKQHSQ